MSRMCLALVCAVGLSSHVLANAQVIAEDALRGFTAGVSRYLALHHRLEDRMPPQGTRSARGSFSGLIEKLYLASAIRSARSSACEGSIIDAPAAAVFRSRIAAALASPEGAASAARFARAASAPSGPEPVVNEPYPAASLDPVPPSILRVLPPLEDDLAYRVANADLILWDVHAEIVVDVLPRAFLPGDGD